MTLLEVNEIHVRYGAILAVRGVSLEVEQGEVVGLIGVNGAGKSTTMNSILGVVKPYNGSIRYNGTPLIGMAPESVLKLGIAPVMEGRRVFPTLTVEENLRLGAAIVKDKKQIAQDLDRWTSHFPILGERFHTPAGNLSGGQQQMLAVARALMSRPQTLLMDEPSLGLAPIMVRGVFELILELRSLGVTILLVEQNVRMTLEVVDRVYLLSTGTVEFAGTPAELKAEGGIERTYLHASAGTSTVATIP